MSNIGSFTWLSYTVRGTCSQSDLASCQCGPMRLQHGNSLQLTALCHSQVVDAQGVMAERLAEAVIPIPLFRSVMGKLGGEQSRGDMQWD